MPNNAESCKKTTAMLTAGLGASALGVIGLYNIISNSVLSCPEVNSNSTRSSGQTCQESLLPFYFIGGIVIATSTLALAMYARSRMESRATTAPIATVSGISLEMPQQNSSDLNRSTPSQTATNPLNPIVGGQLVFATQVEILRRL